MKLTSHQKARNKAKRMEETVKRNPLPTYRRQLQKQKDGTFTSYSPEEDFDDRY